MELIFHTLCNNLQAKLMSQQNDCTDNCRIISVSFHIHYK
ncbi:hypothetical protein CCP3SC1_910001 [Gammaproteobacteria bacterium]